MGHVGQSVLRLLKRLDFLFGDDIRVPLRFRDDCLDEVVRLRLGSLLGLADAVGLFVLPAFSLDWNSSEMLVRMLSTEGHLDCLYISVVVAVRSSPRSTVSRYLRRISMLISPRLSTMLLPVVIIFLIYSSGFSPVFLPPFSLKRTLSSFTHVPQVDST